MKVLGISVILIFKILKYCIGGMIITTVQNIDEYAKNMIVKVFDPKCMLPTPQQRLSFCRELITARMFYMAAEYVTLESASPLIGQEFIFNTAQQAALENLCNRIPCLQRRWYSRSELFLTLWSVECLIPYPPFSWVASVDEKNKFGLLFEKRPMLNLIGIIDLVPQLVGHSPQKLSNAVMIDGVLDSHFEPLCKLKKLFSIFRVCAICAEALIRSEQNQSNEYNVTDDGDLISLRNNDNFWNSKENMTSCPILKVSVAPSWTVDMIALHCQGSIRKNPYDFYLKMKRTQTGQPRNSLFILVPDNGDIISKDEIIIPQMENILHTDKLKRGSRPISNAHNIVSVSGN